MSTNRLNDVRAYHERTKHHFGRFARGPGRLDWATQPDPFRRYAGAPLLPLGLPAPDEGPGYETVFPPGAIAPQPLSPRSLSQLLFDSLAISAWKQAGDARWALRVNPSSGNLHPTEGYLLCGPVPGLSERSLVAHYAPREHALEVRGWLPAEAWQMLIAGLPPGRVISAVGLSSIHWREAWKYGERAFRYCQLDVGHALAAVSLAAAGLGWSAVLLDDLGSAQIAELLGLHAPLEDPGDLQGAEPEQPDCLLALYPQGDQPSTPGPRPQADYASPLAPRPQADYASTLGQSPEAGFQSIDWLGVPNRLSPRHVAWPIIEEVAVATEKPPTALLPPPGTEAGASMRMELPPGTRAEAEWGTEPPPRTGALLATDGGPSLRQIVRQRRSAVAMDRRGSLPRDAFYRILSRTVPSPGEAPWSAWPWPPQVHLVLFVHRVEGLAPGLYLLVREPAQEAALRTALRGDFAWARPPGCPAEVPLYRLQAGDARAAARQLSCGQAIASDGCFSLGMLAAFAAPLARFGPWFYRRLHWECGMIGQVLYLEAEVAGVRGTGIGCFFDDGVHELLAPKTDAFQSLYHFTVGHPVDDPRLTTLPAYPPPG